MLLAEMFEVELGTVPVDESCGQSGFPNGTELQRMECREFAAQIERALGPLPEGASWKARRNPYEDMSYYELVYRCPDDDQAGMEYADRVENECPTQWDEVAKTNLAAKGYFSLLEENRKGGRNRW